MENGKWGGTEINSPPIFHFPFSIFAVALCTNPRAAWRTRPKSTADCSQFVGSAVVAPLCFRVAIPSLATLLRHHHRCGPTFTARSQTQNAAIDLERRHHLRARQHSRRGSLGGQQL